MRQIRFRLWDNKKKKMLYSRKPDKEDEIVICLNGKPYKHWFIDMGYGDGAGGDLYDASDRYTPLQFTGLLDKSGKEIYEGDILRNNNYPELSGVVEFFKELSWESGGSVHPGFYCKEWFEGMGGIESELSYSLGFDGCEVIGNIYENPELLNKRRGKRR